MRILFYNHAAEISGAERGLLAIMYEARSRGHDIALCAPPGSLAREATRTGVTVIPIAPLVLGYTRNPAVLARFAVQSIPPLAGLAWALRRFQPDLAHANSIRSGLVAALALRLVRLRPTLSRSSLVVHVRDALGIGAFNRVVAGIIGREADAIVAISRYAAHDFGIGNSNVHTLHNAIDPALYQAGAAAGRAFRTRLGVPLDAPLVAVVGQLTPWKGQRDALDAFALLRRAHPHAHLAIVGAAKFTGKHRRYDTAAYRDALHARAAAPDLAGHVHFPGEAAAVAAVYAAADLLVVPSWAEPFGRVVIEAMAAGTPVLATAAGGIPEIITHGADGWLVPPRDPPALAAALARLLADPPLRARLAVAAHATVAARFALPAYMERIELIWRRAVVGQEKIRRPDRILFYNHAGEVSGAERVLLDIMGVARQAGHSVLLGAPAGKLTDEAAAMGILVAPLPPLILGYTRNALVLATYVPRTAKTLLKVRGVVRGARPDIVYANSVRSGIVAALALRLVPHRPPLVVHLHDTLGERRQDTWIARFIHRTADAIVAISDYAVRGVGWSNDDKVVMLHNAIDPALYQAGAAAGRAFRTRLGVPLDAPLVAVVGQLTPWKGQRDALDAFALLRRTHPHAHLAIVGAAKFTGKHRRYDTAAYRDALHARAAAPDLAGHVHFPGEAAAVAAVYAAADLLVVPSWAEPFGRVVIEAMAAGTPVLATAAGGIPEIITHGADGWLVPPRDPPALAAALARLLADPPLRARLAVAAHATVAARFALSHYKTKIEALWASVRAANTHDHDR